MSPTVTSKPLILFTKCSCSLVERFVDFVNEYVIVPLCTGIVYSFTVLRHTCTCSKVVTSWMKAHHVILPWQEQE